MSSRPLRSLLPKSSDAPATGAHAQSGEPDPATPAPMSAASPGPSAPTKKQKQQKQPEPTPQPLLAPEHPLAHQGHPAKYRVLFDEALQQNPLAASQLSITGTAVGPNLAATIQCTSASRACIIGGCGVFVAEVAFLAIPMVLRPHLDRSAACEFRAHVAPYKIKVVGTSYVAVGFREAATGHAVVARLHVNVVAVEIAGMDLVIGAETPAMKRERDVDASGVHDVEWGNGEKAMLAGARS